MNNFFDASQTSKSETILYRLLALLAIGVLSTLPAVAYAESATHAELFSGAEIEQLSTDEMAEVRGEYYYNPPATYDFGSDQWEIAYALGDTSLTPQEIAPLIPPHQFYVFFVEPYILPFIFPPFPFIVLN